MTHGLEENIVVFDFLFVSCVFFFHGVGRFVHHRLIQIRFSDKILLEGFLRIFSKKIFEPC